MCRTVVYVVPQLKENPLDFLVNGYGTPQIYLSLNNFLHSNTFWKRQVDVRSKYKMKSDYLIWMLAYHKPTTATFLLPCVSIKGRTLRDTLLVLALLCATAQQSYCHDVAVRRPSSVVRPSVHPSVGRHRFLGNCQVDWHQILLTGTYSPYP